MLDFLRVHKTLPAVYDDSLSYYEVLCKLSKNIEDLNKYFDEIEIDEKLNQILREKIAEGTIQVGFTYNSQNESLSLIFTNGGNV